MVEPSKDLLKQIKLKWIEEIESQDLDLSDEAIEAFVDDITSFFRDNPKQIELFKSETSQLDRAIKNHVAFVLKAMNKTKSKVMYRGPQERGVVDAETIAKARASCGPHRFDC